MTDTPDRDPCEKLEHICPPPQDERLRHAVWGRVQGRLRRRLWLKHAAVAAALAACYVVGFGTARLGTEPSLPVQTVGVKNAGQAAGADVPSVSSLPSPLAQEWQALDSPEPRPDLALQAGDRYAAEEGDYQSALRCYRGALDAGSDKDRAINPKDSWLLMVLKDARQKERRHADAQN
jgi:hypothetical protein